MVEHLRQTCRRRSPAAVTRIPIALSTCLAAMVGAAFGSGCTTPPPTPEPLGMGEVAWPFRPVEMTFHPLSRADSADAATTLLLRIDFRDPDGDPVKAVGVLEIVVEAPTATPTSRRWSFDLTDPAENRTLFDPVTLAYRLRLRSPWDTPPRPGDPVRLRGRLDCGDRRLDAAADVVW